MKGFNPVRSFLLILPLLLALQVEASIRPMGHHELEKRSPYDPAIYNPADPTYMAPTPTPEPTPTYTPTPTAPYPGQAMRKKRSPSPVLGVVTGLSGGLLGANASAQQNQQAKTQEAQLQGGLTPEQIAFLQALIAAQQQQ